jgi:hypothetical protein
MLLAFGLISGVMSLSIPTLRASYLVAGHHISTPLLVGDCRIYKLKNISKHSREPASATVLFRSVAETIRKS